MLDTITPPPLLDVRGVTLQYKTRDHLVTATYRVDFSVHRSDQFILLGPSGCGKSTLLKAVGGYMAPVEGGIQLKGKLISRPGPDRMMVFQEWRDLIRLTLDQDSDVRWSAVEALGSSFALLPDKEEGWRHLIWLTQDRIATCDGAQSKPLARPLPLLPDGKRAGGI